MFFKKFINHLVLSSMLLSTPSFAWADVIEAETDDEKVYEQDKLDVEIQKAPALAPTNSIKQTSTLKEASKNQVPIDVAFPEFSQTQKGRKYIQQNGKPRVHDIWGNPPEKNIFTDLIKREEAKKKKAKSKLKFPPRRSLKKTSFLYEVLDFFIGSAHALDDAHPTIPGIINCRSNNSVQGYFKAYFEDMALNNGNGTNAGYDDPVKGPARRTAICEVLREIAQIIKLDGSTTPRTPDIIFKADLPASFAANALAAATPVFGLGQSASGADNGSLHKHLVSREDPTPGAGSFDAYVYTNWNICWDVDATTCSNQFIFKTVITHEILHAMGFLGSLAPVVLASGTGANHSTFNEFSYGQANTQGSAINAFFNFTQPLSPVVNAPTGSPSPWFINNLGVYQGRSNYVGANPDGVRAMFNPPSWNPGSSLSHFDQVRGGTSYMMHPSVGPGETRVIHQHEKEVLCHMGYEVLGLCEGPTPYAKDDFAQAQQFGGNCLNFMANDLSFTGSNNNLKLHQYEVLPQNLSTNVTFHQNSGCTDSSVTNLSLAKFIKINTSQSVTVKYQVKDIVSNRISQPARIVSASCSTSGDEYVCNGDFELGIQDGYPVGGCANAAFTAGPTTGIPFWSALAGSPDFIFRNRPNYPNNMCNFPFTWITTAFLGTNLGSLNIDMPNDGQHAALIVSGEDVRETIYTKLKAPLTVGQWYTISFNTLAHYWMPPAGYPTDFNIKAGLTTTPMSFNWEEPIIPATDYLLAVEELIPISITGQSNWTSVNWDFYADQPYQYLHVHYAKFNGVLGLPVIGYIDDISIRKANFNSISGVVYNDVNANGVKDPGEQGLNGLTVKLFNSAIAAQALQTTMTAPSGGTSSVNGSFSFPSLDPLNYYYLVISPENSVASFTQPPTNNNYLSVYQRTIRVPFTIGGHITDQNFGVLLTGQPSSNNLNLTAIPRMGCKATDGGIDLTVSGGVAPYTYSWSNGGTTQDLGGISAGSYTVTVTDSSSPQLSANLTVTVPAFTPTSINGVVTSTSTGGNINITATGNAPLYYNWSNGSTSEDLNNLPPGTYTVIVADANKCTQSATFTIAQSDAQNGACCKIKPNANPLIDCSNPYLNFGNSTVELGRNRCEKANSGNSCYWDFSNPACCYPGGQGCGSVEGTTCAPPAVSIAYPFTSLNNSTYQEFYKKCMNQAEVSNNQNYYCCVTLATSLNLSASTKPSCDGKSGGISISVSGGTAPYTYSWNNGQTTQNAINLVPGNYTVTVTDANGSIGVLTVSIPNIGPVVINGSVSNAVAPNYNNGAINITVTPPIGYSYNWTKSGSTSWSSTLEDLSNLGVGGYTVTAVNKYGCRGSKTFSVKKILKTPELIKVIKKN